MEDDLRELVQQRYGQLVLGDGEWAKVQFVCAETGMGKTLLAKGLIAQSQRMNRHTRYVSLLDMTSDQASARVVRLARDLASASIDKASHKLVVIDDVPPFDECDLGRVVRAIGRMTARNCLVIVNLLPESLVLAEEVQGAVPLTSADMADLFRRDDGRGGEAVSRRTAGIAALELAGLPPRPGMSPRGRATQPGGPTYQEALSHLAAAHVRKTLPLEEQRLRLAILLLGRGSVDELTSVVGRIDPDALEELRAAAPLLGIQTGCRAFRVVGSTDPSCLAALTQGLNDACERLPDTAAGAAQVLLNRGDLRHGAAVIALCQQADRIRLGCSWGVELICAGEVPTVREALRLHEEAGLNATTSQVLAERALGILCDSTRHLDERPLPSGAPVGREAWQARTVELLRACRDLDRGMSPRNMPPRADETGLHMPLRLHIRARRLLLRGSVSEAYTLLVNNPDRLRPRSLPAALLADDFRIAQMLNGEAPHEAERQAFEAAQELLARAGLERLVAYGRVLAPALMVLAGRSVELDGLEVAIQHASRMGDDAVHAVLLLCGAVLDNRRGAYPRAHVRALQAADLLTTRLGSGLLRIARLVDALAALGLGDDTPLANLALGRPSAVRDLAALMVVGDASGGHVNLTKLAGVNMPSDVLWLLNVLCNDMGDRSRLFRQAIPTAWSAASRRSVRRMQSLERIEDRAQGQSSQAPSLLPAPAAAYPPLARTATLPAERASQHQAPPARQPSPQRIPSARPVHARVELAVLGRFEVRVDGHEIPATRFMRRRARAFMTMLAIAEGHQMRRFELLDAVWPESDFDHGRQHVYEATSTARQLLRTVDETLDDPFVSIRNGGSIMLDNMLVECDVDRFEGLAHAAIAQDDDEAAISLACQVLEVYQGELCETPYDATGYASARREELRELFVDAVCAGAQAALNEEQAGLAVRLAQAAHDANDMREDAVLALIGALRLAGRSMDAREAYRAFARRILDATGEPPSASLRASVGDLFPQLRTLRQRREDRPDQDLPKSA